MGQLALGLRSLIVRLTIFVIMAALLAWALGGTLFPRPTIVTLSTTTAGPTEYQWELHSGDMVAGGQQWQLLSSHSGAMAPLTCSGWWSRPLGPIWFEQQTIIGGSWLGLDGPDSGQIPTARQRALAITPEGACQEIALTPAMQAALTGLAPTR